MSKKQREFRPSMKKRGIQKERMQQNLYSFQVDYNIKIRIRMRLQRREREREREREKECYKKRTVKKKRGADRRINCEKSNY